MIGGETADDTSISGNKYHCKEQKQQNQETTNRNGNTIMDGIKCDDQILPTFHGLRNKGRQPEKGICRKLEDKIYRSKFIETLWLGWSFLFLGWIFGQSGPSFLDLIHITGTDIEKGSAFNTSGFVGFLIGALLSGFLYDRFNKHLLLVAVVLGCALVVATIPWCFLYETMIVAQGLVGVFRGALDVVGNAQCLVIWGIDNGPYMQAIHFAFGIGGIMSPLVTAPFLLPKTNHSLRGKNTEYGFSNKTLSVKTVLANYTVQEMILNTVQGTSTHKPIKNIIDINRTLSDVKMLYKFENNISVNNDTVLYNFTTSFPEKRQSQVYKAFFITSSIGMSAALAYFVQYLKSRQQLKKNKGNKDKEIQSKRKMSKILKLLALANMMMILGVFGVVEGMLVQYLSVFCVTFLNWSKYNSSLITSFYWVAFALGRFAGIFLIKCFYYVNILCFFSAFLILDVIALLICSLSGSNIGVWIFAPLTGVGLSIMFPVVFTWTEAELFPVTGKISSLFLIGASSLRVVNPLILGYLMEEYSAMYFCYLAVGYSILLLILCFSAICVVRKINKTNKGHFYTDQEVEISLTDHGK